MRAGQEGQDVMQRPIIVSPQEWKSAHEKLLVKEKALIRARDALAAERRRMPWLAVEKAYAFDSPNGTVSLRDLFEGRRQLIVYRAFFEPGVHGWPEHACIGCSMVADQVSHLSHLNARDTTLVFASRAPQADIARLKARMGWEDIPWVTITDSFDADFGVDQWHGHNAFIRDGERIFRTYLINSRGDEAMGTVWSYLDMTALDRQEEWEDSPEGYPQTRPYKWWNWHDSYVPGAAPDQDRGLGRRRGRLQKSRGVVTVACHAMRGGKASAASWLSLAATPTFALMALLAAIHDGGMPDMMCSAGSPMSGMVTMYMLMSAFHLGP
jgi:predicted dithiol-disulfide oxidoreductase (DUF899 family)